MAPFLIEVDHGGCSLVSVVFRGYDMPDKLNF